MTSAPPLKTLQDALRLGRALVKSGRPVSARKMPSLVGLKVGGSTNVLRRAAREFGLIEAGAAGFVATDLMRRLAGDVVGTGDLLEALRYPPSYSAALTRFGTDLTTAPLDELQAVFLEFCGGAETVGTAVRVFQDSVAHALRAGVASEPVAAQSPRVGSEKDEPMSFEQEGQDDVGVPSLTAGTGPEATADPVRIPVNEVSTGGGGLQEHPLIKAVFSVAPPVGSEWPRERREAFIDMMRSAIVSLYPSCATGPS